MASVKPCYLYIILCRNEHYYTGITNDYIRRWNNHKKKKGARYIKIYGFKEPVYLEKFPNKGEAMKKERKIKRMSLDKKKALITSKNNILPKKIKVLGKNFWVTKHL